MADTEMTIRELNALIETHLDAAEVVKDGVQGLQNPALRSAAQNMLNDHQQEATRLQNRVRQLGGTPAMDEHATNKLKESWQEIWEEGGGDQEVLLALRANERVAVDGFKLNLTQENIVQTLSEEGLREHKRALEMELDHFRQLTDELRAMGAEVDNDSVMGAVRNATEHIHAAINLSGTAVEAFMKWATGTGRG